MGVVLLVRSQYFGTMQQEDIDGGSGVNSEDCMDNTCVHWQNERGWSTNPCLDSNICNRL